MGYATITLGSVDLFWEQIEKNVEPSVNLQVIGKHVVELPVLGKNSYQTRISANGIIIGSGTKTIDQHRTDVEALEDGTKKKYTDGIDSGSYIITRLTWTDAGAQPSRYNMELIEYDQT